MPTAATHTRHRGSAATTAGAPTAASSGDGVVSDRLRARIPADVDASDRILGDLTARQVAVLAVAAATGYLTWQALHARVPVLVLVLAGIPIAGLAVALALVRRDGLGLDTWLAHAAAYARAPRRLLPARVPPPPPWAPATQSSQASQGPGFGVLRFPADAVDRDGTIRTSTQTRPARSRRANQHNHGGRPKSVPSSAAVLVGVSTLNVTTRTPGDQAGLIAGYARWLNGLTRPAQIVISTRRVDLASHAVRVADTAHLLGAPSSGSSSDSRALADAALGYAEFLLDLAEDGDPLARTVTVATSAHGRNAHATAHQAAQQTAAGLAALGATSAVLDGPAATALLTTAVDPYQPGDAACPRAVALPSHVPGGISDVDHTGLTSVVGPHAVEVGPHDVRVGDGWAASLVVTGYPAEVGVAWLEPVLATSGGAARVDVAIHVTPLPAAAAAAGLRRSRARVEASRRLDADRGRLDDPAAEVTAGDARDLAERLARGQVRLFRVGIYLTVHAPTRGRLRDAVAQVRAAAAASLLDTQPTTWRQLQGWLSTLPFAHDNIKVRRVFDTDALALAFPLAGPDLPAPLPGRGWPGGGVLVGINPASGGIVWWDRWAQHNHNTLILARSGAGKSYLVKLDVLRSLFEGVRVAVIDPEDEYPALAEAVGGTTIRLGTPGVRVNPLDLPTATTDAAASGTGASGADVVTRRALFVHTLVAVLLGQPPAPEEAAALDTAIAAAYARAGITDDPTTWGQPAPLLADVVACLESATDPTDQTNTADAAGRTLAVRLRPWTHGSFRGLFDGPTTTTPGGRLTVWSVRHLPDELRAAGILLALDTIWRDVDTGHDVHSDIGDVSGRPAHNGAGLDNARAAAVEDTDLDGSDRDTSTSRGTKAPTVTPVRRLVVVDEAWTLLRDEVGARFLYRLAKAARKRRAGLVVVTQDAADLLATDLGQAVAANAATQVLMRQAPQAIDAITAAFGLTGDEARMLLTAPRGHGLLLGASHRVGFRAVASPREHVWCRGPGEPDDAHEPRDSTRGTTAGTGRA